MLIKILLHRCWLTNRNRIPNFVTQLISRTTADHRSRWTASRARFRMDLHIVEQTLRQIAHRPNVTAEIFIYRKYKGKLRGSSNKAIESLFTAGIVAVRLLSATVHTKVDVSQFAALSIVASVCVNHLNCLRIANV